jgi:hypothetical protein
MFASQKKSVIAAHGRGVYTATGPSTPITFARDCNSVILATGLNGVTGIVGQGDNWKPVGKFCRKLLQENDWRIFRTGEQLLPRYVIHFNMISYLSLKDFLLFFLLFRFFNIVMRL